MHSVPSKIVEKIIFILIPPASREEVLGDLREGYTSSGQYMRDALGAVPMVILSKIRRTADPQILLMEGTIAYLSYIGAAWYERKTSLFEDPGFLRLAFPPVLVLLGVILDDAYADPSKRSHLKLTRGPILGVGLAYLSQLAMSAGDPTLTLPIGVMFYGSAATLLLSVAVRMLFPSALDRQVGASGAVLWLKQAAEPPRIAPGAIPVIKLLAKVLLIASVGAQLGGPSVCLAFILISIVFLVVRELNRKW